MILIQLSALLGTPEQTGFRGAALLPAKAEGTPQKPLHQGAVLATWPVLVLPQPQGPFAQVLGKGTAL